MSKKKFDIICVIDRSGSMGGLYEEAVDTFNEYINMQRENEMNANITVYSFDDQLKKVVNKVDIKQMQVLQYRDFRPRGMTALNYAMMTAMQNGDAKRPTIMYTMTDGLENYSNRLPGRYTKADVSNMRAELEAAGWEFEFFGAGINADVAADGYGIRQKSKKTFSKDAKGMADMKIDMLATTEAYSMKIESI